MFVFIKISTKNIIFCATLISSLIIVFALLLPIWDYADIISRNDRFLKTENQSLNTLLVALKFIGLYFSDLKEYSNCTYYSENKFCNELQFDLLIERLFFNVKIYISILCGVYIYVFYKASFIKNPSKKDLSSLNLFLLSICFPSSVYFMSGVTFEVLLIPLSILFITTYKSYLKYIVIIISFLIDDNEVFILLTFLIFEKTFNFIRKHFSQFYLFTMLCLVIIFYLLTNEIKIILSFFMETQKLDSIILVIDEKGSYLTNTLILRIFYSFKGLLIATPHHFLAFFFTMSCLFGVLFLIVKNIKTLINKFKDPIKFTFNEHLLLIGVLTQTLLVIIFPLHSYSKYYMFIIPLVLNVLLKKYNFRLLFYYTFLGYLLLILDLSLFIGV